METRASHEEKKAAWREIARARRVKAKAAAKNAKVESWTNKQRRIEKNLLQQEIESLQRRLNEERELRQKVEARCLALEEELKQKKSEQVTGSKSQPQSDGQFGEKPSFPEIQQSLPVHFETTRKVCDCILQRRQNLTNLLGVGRDMFFQLIFQVQSFQHIGYQPTLELKYLVFICLFWMHTGASFLVLSILFWIPPTTLRRQLDYTTKLLAHVLRKEIRWPSADEWNSEVGKWKVIRRLRYAVCCLDGKFFEVSDRRRGAYSKYHHGYGKNILFICKFTGEIVWHGSSQWGASDQREWNTSKKRADFEGQKFGVVADGGFTLNPKKLLRKNPSKKIKGYTPFTLRNRTRILPMQKRYNYHLSAWRVLIEQVFAQMSNRFQIFQTRFPREGNSGPTLDNVVTTASAIHNRLLIGHSLRTTDWAPPNEKLGD
jgi:hypothetical protein